MGLIILAMVLINLTPVQNYISHLAAGYLTDKLQTKVEVRHIRLDFLNKIKLEGVYIEDLNRDTLLYAGSLEGKITNWFIFKDKATVDYLKLKDAVVNMERSGPKADWNFQFIIDAFEPKTPKPKKETEFPDLDIKELSLINVRFRKMDDSFGNGMVMDVGSLYMEGEDIDLGQKKIYIRTFNTGKFQYYISKASTGAPVTDPVFPDLKTKTPFNPKGYDIRLDELHIKDGIFVLNTLDEPVLANQFDGRHLDIQDIQIDAADIVVRDDTLTGKMIHLSSLDRSGVEIKKMSGDVTVNPNISEIKNLYLETNRSVLKDYFAMVYQQFPDFRDYIHRVKMVTRVRGSRIAMEDIAYFAPALLRWKGKVYHGNMDGQGTVAALDIRNIDLRDDQLHFTGDYKMTGLPDIDHTTIDYQNGMISTHYRELTDLFPEIKKLDIEQFQAIDQVVFSGDVYGKYNHLTVNGNLLTNMGAMLAKKLELDYSGQHFLYKGNVSSADFNFDPMFPDAGLGTAAFDLNLDGNGFNYKTNKIHADGFIHSFGFNDYVYQNISLDIDIQDGNIDADIDSEDPNANVDITALITDLESKPDYDIDGEIHWIDFRTIGLLDRPLQGKGVIHARLQGSGMKDIVGQAALEELLLVSGRDTLSYDSLVFTSEREGLENFVSITTNNLQVTVNGLFFIDELVNSTQKYLSYYMSEYIPEPAGYTPDQQFDFSIEAADPDELISVFLPQLRISQGLKIEGRLDGAAQRLELSGNIPFLQYKNLLAKNISINSTGDLSGMNFNLHANQFTSNEKEMISDFDFMAVMSDNHLDFDIKTTSDNTFGTARINGQAFASNDSFYLELNPSELFFNSQKWDISGGNQTVFARDYMHIHNLVVQSDNQVMEINTDAHHTDELGAAMVYMDNINVRPILAMVGMEDLKLEGRVNGEALVRGLPRSISAEFALTGSRLTTNENELGELKLVGSYIGNENKLILEEPSGMYDKNGHISLEGTLRIDTARRNEVDFWAKGSAASLTWAEPFAADLVRDLSGTVDGYIHIKGTFPQPEIDGKVNITEGHFTPLITGVDYVLPVSEIDITSNLFTIKNCEIRDDEGHSGELSGTIRHEYFANLDFALRMVSDKIKVLDKEENDEEVETFYGKVYAGVNLTLRGLLRDLQMNITARTAEHSKLFIPLTSDTDLEEYEYITFRKPENDESTEQRDEKKTRLSINLDAIANPGLEAEIIIDPVAGDKINAIGSGNLTMFIPPDGDIRLNGSYYIESGFYDFTFNSLQLLRYKNRFNLLSGSVINWDGDIADATVDVKANTIKRARLYDLITDDVMRGAVTFDNASSERSDALTPQNIIIDMQMTGKLLSPDLKFKLELEETRSIGTYAYQKLQRINQDERDLVNQVLSLLVLNQFLPMEGVNSNVAVNTGVSNVAEIISTFASSQITNFTNKVLGVEDLWVNLKYKNYNITDEITSGNLNYLNRNEAGLSVRKNFFNDRLVLDVGGVYDWGMGSYASGSNYTTNLTGDFRLAYLLTPDGRLRLNIFRTSSFDAVSLQNIGRHGVGFTYRKSFNDFYDLFGIKRRSDEASDSAPGEKNAAPPPDNITPQQNNSDSLPSQDTPYTVPSGPDA